MVAFKFGGSSLLGAERMLHAAGLVRAGRGLIAGDRGCLRDEGRHRSSACDRAISRRIAEPRAPAREAEFFSALHLDVLRDLSLDCDDHDSRRPRAQLLGRDLLHEVPAQG